MECVCVLYRCEHISVLLSVCVSDGLEMILSSCKWGLVSSTETHMNHCNNTQPIKGLQTQKCECTDSEKNSISYEVDRMHPM